MLLGAKPPGPVGALNKQDIAKLHFRRPADKA
jgi:hypothetical protein